MKFVCTQENLNQGLLVASHINTRNINLPILNNVLLKVENNLLKLISTNLEIAVVTKIRGKAESDGEFTLPSKLLSDYISLLPKENIMISLENDFVHISCANHLTKIKGIEPSDFPLIPQLKKENIFYIDGEIFKKALNQVSFAVLSNESRPEISGVYMNFNNEEGLATLVATDSFRLAEKKIKLDIKSSKNKAEFIVPLKTVWELNNILSVSGSIEGGLLEIALDEGQIFFGIGNTELTSRLVEGSFPDYNQIIPKEFNSTAKLSVKNLLSGAKSASLFSRSGLNDIKISFISTENKVDVYSTDNQTGEQKTTLNSELTGANNKIVLNHKYLMDGLVNLNASEAIIEVIDENSPCIIKPANEDNYIYIVMPIKQ